MTDREADTTREMITLPLARWASGVRYEDLGDDALHQVKRFLLDSIGCARQDPSLTRANC